MTGLDFGAVFNIALCFIAIGFALGYVVFKKPINTINNYRFHIAQPEPPPDRITNSFDDEWYEPEINKELMKKIKAERRKQRVGRA